MVYRLPSSLTCLVLVLALLGGAGCAPPGPPLYPVLPQEDPRYTRYFPYADILEIPLSRQGLEEMVRFIHTTYKRDANGQTIPLGRGHNHRHSMFYLAEGDYSMFNTCNSWISKALQAAGLPVKTALRAEGVMRQAKHYGQMIQIHAEAAQ
jgi:hypothetical protein